MDFDSLKHKAEKALSSLSSIEEELENYLKSLMISRDLKEIPLEDCEFLYSENNYYVFLSAVVLDDTGLMIKTTDNHYYDFSTFTDAAHKIDIVEKAVSKIA